MAFRYFFEDEMVDQEGIWLFDGPVIVHMRVSIKQQQRDLHFRASGVFHSNTRGAHVIRDWEGLRYDSEMGS